MTDSHVQVQELFGTLSYPSDSYSKKKWPDGSRCLASYIVAFGPLPLDAAKHIFYQLVDAVALLHSKGITHCDIKPENILLDADTLDVSANVCNVKQPLLTSSCVNR